MQVYTKSKIDHVHKLMKKDIQLAAGALQRRMGQDATIQYKFDLFEAKG